MRIQKIYIQGGGGGVLCVRGVQKPIFGNFTRWIYDLTSLGGGGRGAAPFMPHVPLDLPIEMKVPVLVYINIE